MKRKLPKPAPEQTPQRTDEHDRRISKLQEKQLLAGAAELGDRLNKALVRLAEACTPVDEMVPGEDIYSPEARDAVSTALANGKDAEAIAQNATKTIDTLTRENRQGIHGIAQREKQAEHPPGRRDIEREQARRQAAMDRFFIKRMTGLLAVQRAAEKMHRPVFSALVEEMRHASGADTIVDYVEMAKDEDITFGSGNTALSKAMSNLTRRYGAEDQNSRARQFFPWTVLGYETHLGKCKIKPGENPFGQLHIDKVREWLQTVDLQATGQKPHVIPLDGIRFLDKPLLLRLHIPDDLHTFSIAGFDIIFSDRAADDGAIIAGEFSRLTADITTHGMWVYSPRRLMELFSAGGLYDKIRFEVIKAVYQQYEQEQLPEEDRLALRELLSENPRALQKTVTETPLPITPDIATDTATTALEQPAHTASTTPVPPTPADFDTFGEMGTRKKRRLREMREGDATYKMGVMAVKKRFLRLPGIRFSTKTGDHGHFFGPKGKVQFYNEHRAERMLTLREIEDKLTQMGYDLDQFWNV